MLPSLASRSAATAVPPPHVPGTRAAPRSAARGPSTASAIVIKLVEDMQVELAGAIESFVRTHGVPASAKGGLPSELVAAYRAFPNSEPFYSRALNPSLRSPRQRNASRRSPS